MTELLDAYQRTHETMGTLAKNVGKNNEELENTAVQLVAYSSTIDKHHKQIEILSQTQDIQKESIQELHKSVAMLCDVEMTQESRIDMLAARINDLEQMVKRTHKQIFWCLVAVIIVNVGGLIAFHMVTP